MKHKFKITFLVILSTATVFAKKEGVNPFSEGKNHFESGNYVRALALFSRVIHSPPDKTTRNLAYYYQGMSFFELGHYYSSFLSFRNVLFVSCFSLVRGWNECYDQVGRINRVHPKDINGQSLVSPHYPLIAQEIIPWHIQKRFCKGLKNSTRSRIWTKTNWKLGS